jgi:hypothetical protein
VTKGCDPHTRVHVVMTSRRTHRFGVPCCSWLSLWYPLLFVVGVPAGVAATTGTIAVFREIRGNVRVCSVVVRECTEKRVCGRLLMLEFCRRFYGR